MDRSISNMAYRYHFIGIGGIGMSGMAQILLNKGFQVSGSDLKKSDATVLLENKGAVIHYTHDAKHIDNTDVIIYSSAVQKDNVEFAEALKQRKIIIPRAELLNSLCGSEAIAICGTHGKTTTSSILSKILFDAGMDPTILLGGIAPFIASNSYDGRGRYTVFEACEAYGSLHYYYPKMVLINNLDIDHIDYFGTMDAIIEEFRYFIKKIPYHGALFINSDDENLMKLVENYHKPIVRFGLSDNLNDYTARNIQFQQNETSFDLYNQNKKTDNIRYPLAGKHNVYNMLAAISISLYLGLDIDVIKKSIKEFKNSDRRLQLIAEQGDIKLYTDYAHHPTEISATLDSLKQNTVNNRIISIFQPHLFSRTRHFYKEFALALEKSDYVCLLPVYPAREKEIPGVSSDMIKNEMIRNGFEEKVSNFLSQEELSLFLKDFLGQGDVVITLGAGDINEYTLDIKNEILPGINK